MLVLVGLVLALRLGGEVRAVLGSWRRLRYLLLSSVLISINWGLFIWSVQSGHVLDASLGYFINPLVSVALGVIVLREKLRPAQRVSLAVAALGVLVLVIWRRELPMVALGLAVTFGLYGLVRKVAPVESIVGLTVETLVVTPIALVYLVVQTAAGASVFVTAKPSFVAFVALAGADHGAAARVVRDGRAPVATLHARLLPVRGAHAAVLARGALVPRTAPRRAGGGVSSRSGARSPSTHGTPCGSARKSAR